ncbi:SLIT and NTRK-like protein 6 [Spea bombifrons]|uniref:SLIT and NTRK-like protein 6 n=1 Tax=Spea bombifrons TaxID=233779 RepID=UPI0023493E88|nr:SLIT and NTRK-like protein 6 [Spea bombifrons]
MAAFCRKKKIVLNNMIVTFTLLFLLITSSTRGQSDFLSIDSCQNLCICEEKDTTLFVNCEGKHELSLSKINLPPSHYLDLNLMNIGLYKLKVNAFSGFHNIISLHLGFNNIVDIEQGAFHDLRVLKKLHINHNSLEILKEDTFVGLENLEFLQADNNFITTIEPNTFSKLNRLKVLILNDNAIDFLPVNIFRFVPLTHLDLRGNQLQTLPYVGFLEHIGRIIEFQLEDNRWVCNCDLLQLKSWLENLPQQSTVGDVVCHNPPNLKGTLLRKLKKEMICSSNPTNELIDSSGPLSLVGTASLDGRMPTKSTSVQKATTKDTMFVFPKSTTLLPGLYCPFPCHCSSHTSSGTLIHCQERNIESVSDLGPPPQNPRKLFLAGNIIHVLHKWDFIEYGSLEMLHLASNHIEIIEEASFLNLTKVQKLYLNGNHLRSLNAHLFVGLVNIEYLYLEYNSIKDISPGTFSFMPKLKVLYLNNNLLHTLPNHIFAGVPLTTLNLKTNQFVHFPSKVLDDLNWLLQIELQDNPWNCTCNLIELKNWTQVHKYVLISEIMCNSPKELYKMELKSLYNEVLCPEFITSQGFPTQSSSMNHTIPYTVPSQVDNILRSLSDYIPLSVLILGLLIFLITTVLCSAGIIVLVLHRRRRCKKKQEIGQMRETSPVHIQYSMYGHKTTHQTTEQPRSTMYEERVTNPIIQVYQTPPFSPKHSEQEEDSDKEVNNSKRLYREILHHENNSPLTGSNLKFGNDQSTEFLSFQDASYLYRNLIEKEKEIQQLGIAEYLRKNIANSQADVNAYRPGTLEEIKLMEALTYSRSRKVLVEQTKNEYFELKANLHSEPDYLEVLEQQT